MAQTTILVVDDSPFASKQIKDSVEGQGYQVIGYAQNGEEGIRMYEELHPDIVILDIIMDTLVDSVKLLPFLFLTYLALELLEHKAGGKLLTKISVVDKATKAPFK